MGNLRETLSKPLGFNLSHVRSEPFDFALATSLPPLAPNQVRDVDKGHVTNYHPWGIEQWFQLDTPLDNGQTAYFVRYVLPGSDTEAWLVSCLDVLFESYFALITGRDYGDQVIPLVADRCPWTLELLMRSVEQDKAPLLIQMVTSQRQWGVAIPIPLDPMSADFEITPEEGDGLLKGTIQALAELMNPDALMPDLVYILGSGDYVSRLLRTSAELLGAIGDIADIVDAFR